MLPMALANAGDGLSWETAYVIANIKVEQNTTDYGLVFANLSHYIIIHNSVFYNFLPGYSGYRYSILIQNSSHIRIESCFLKAVSGSNSVGIKIEQSSDISLNDMKFIQFYQGVAFDESHNCTIADSIFWGQYRSNIQLRHSDNIAILNNEMYNPYSDPNFNGLDAINGDNVSECMIVGNEMDSLRTTLHLYEAKNVVFRANQLPYSTLYHATNLTFTENEINGNLYLATVINLTVERNIFQGGQYGIEASNVYNFRIGENTFRQISNDIFLFTYDTDWLEPPVDSQELIVNNHIFLVVGELCEAFPPNIIMYGNLIVPHAGFFIFLIISLGCITLYLNSLLLYRKKVSHIQSTLQKIPEEGETNQQLTSPFTMLLEMERARFRQTSYRLVIWLGLFCAFAFSEIFFAGRVVRTLLEWFTGDSYHSEVKLRAFLTAVELGILGAILFKSTLHKLQSVNRMPKLMQNHENHLTTLDKRLITVITGTIAILEIILVLVMYRGNFPVLMLVIGFIASLGFLINLLLKFRHKAGYLGFEFLMFGVLFIIGYILILNSNDINYNNAKGVIATQSLLSWGFFLIGGIGWARAFFSAEELDFTRESQKGDISDGTGQ